MSERATQGLRMVRQSFAEVFAEGLAQFLERDERALLIGYFVNTRTDQVGFDRIRERFQDRVISPPISEAGFCGLAIGAAMLGGRPFVDLVTSTFAYNAFPQIVGEAANAFDLTGGKVNVPVIFHLLSRVGTGYGAQHSHAPQSMLWNTPGLRIALPATAADLKGLMTTAFETDAPTVLLTHQLLLGTEDDVPAGVYRIPFGKALVRRRGSEVSLVGTSWMVQECLKAADMLAAEGIEVEVVDLRSLTPLDEDLLLESVERTGRVVIVDECHRRCGIAAEIAAVVTERTVARLKAPVRRVTARDEPISYSQEAEAAALPSPAEIASVARALVRGAQ